MKFCQENVDKCKYILKISIAVFPINVNILINKQPNVIYIYFR